MCHSSLELSHPPATHLAPVITEVTTLPMPEFPLQFYKGQKPQQCSCPVPHVLGTGRPWLPTAADAPHGCEDKGNLLDAQKKLNLEREFVSNYIF